MRLRWAGSLWTLWMAFAPTAWGQCAARAQTVAGLSGAGDGGPAVSALLNWPQGLALDDHGNLYVADSFHHRIRKITPEGRISTVAGTGLPGAGGDGGPAVHASLNEPRAVGVDAAGNLYIADLHNHRIRKVTPQGIISTLAGTGRAQSTPDGALAAAAPIEYPMGVAVDRRGNVYFSESGRNLVRVVDRDGRLATIAGTGLGGYSGDGGPAREARLDSPTDLAIDAAGNLYIADVRSGRVRRVDPSGIITTVAGNGSYKESGDNGPALQAGLGSISGLAVDAQGNLFIASLYESRVRKVDLSGRITNVAGNGLPGFAGDGWPIPMAQFNMPTGLAVDRMGNVYVSDRLNARVRKVSVFGRVYTVAGRGQEGFSGDGGPAVEARLRSPEAVLVDAAGNLLIADSGNHRVRKVTPTGEISTVAGRDLDRMPGYGGPALNTIVVHPSGLAADAEGDLYITSFTTSLVLKLSPSGTITVFAGNFRGYFGFGAYTGDGGPAAAARLDHPAAVATDAAGNVYIADALNHAIRKVTRDGIITTVVGNGVAGFSGDGGPAKQAQLNMPMGVAIDRNGNLYIADTNNRRVRKVDPSGTITTVAGGSHRSSPLGVAGTSFILTEPTGLAVDASDNLYIADEGGQHVLRLSPDGMLTSAAGAGWRGFGGDGSTAYSTFLFAPAGLALDSSGHLFVTEKGSPRVQKIDLNCEPVPAAVLRGEDARLRIVNGLSGAEMELPGKFTSNPGVAAEPGGRLVIAALDSDGKMGIGIVDPRRMRLFGWRQVEGPWEGAPAAGAGLTAVRRPVAVVVGRTPAGSYRAVRYELDKNAAALTEDLGGRFVSPPYVAACEDGSVYAMGLDAAGTLWSRRWIAGPGWDAWTRGLSGVRGKISITCGDTQTVTVAAQNEAGAFVLARASGNHWLEVEEPKNTSGGETAVSAGQGFVYVVTHDVEGGILTDAYMADEYYKLKSWRQTGRKLRLLAPAANGGGVEIFGVDEENVLWRYTPGMERWTMLLQMTSAPAFLAGVPR